MASHSHNSSQNPLYSNKDSVDHIDVSISIVEGLNEIDRIIDQFRQEFHRSHDLNQPISDSISIETGWLLEETNIMEMEMSQADEQNANQDLSLRICPPNPIVNSKDQKSSNQSEISSPKSQVSCMSLDLNVTIEDQESTKPPNEEDLPSLILMGCAHCHIFVMVSEADPKCPKCNTAVLLDIFRESPAKKPRKN